MKCQCKHTYQETGAHLRKQNNNNTNTNGIQRTKLYSHIKCRCSVICGVKEVFKSSIQQSNENIPRYEMKILITLPKELSWSMLFHYLSLFRFRYFFLALTSSPTFSVPITLPASDCLKGPLVLFTSITFRMGNVTMRTVAREEEEKTENKITLKHNIQTHKHTNYNRNVESKSQYCDANAS